MMTNNTGMQYGMNRLVSVVRPGNGHIEVDGLDIAEDGSSSSVDNTSIPSKKKRRTAAAVVPLRSKTSAI
jgi:hypothetical protein